MPSQSPVLYSIENMWYVLKKLVCARKPTNLVEVNHFCQEEWQPKDYQKLVDGYQKQQIEVKVAKGHLTKYYNNCMYIPCFRGSTVHQKLPFKYLVFYLFYLIFNLDSGFNCSTSANISSLRGVTVYLQWLLLSLVYMHVFTLFWTVFYSATENTLQCQVLLY